MRLQYCKVVSIIVLIVCISTGAIAINKKSNKKVMIGNVIDVVNKVYKNAKIASHLSTNEKDEIAAIKIILDQIDEIEELKRVAVICHSISSPGNAEDVYFDAWFHQCTWGCITKISETKSRAALESLIYIKDMCNLQGGDYQAIEDIISKAEKRLK